MARDTTAHPLPSDPNVRLHPNTHKFFLFSDQSAQRTYLSHLGEGGWTNVIRRHLF